MLVCVQQIIIFHILSLSTHPEKLVLSFYFHFSNSISLSPKEGKEGNGGKRIYFIAELRPRFIKILPKRAKVHETFSP